MAIYPNRKFTSRGWFSRFATPVSWVWENLGEQIAPNTVTLGQATETDLAQAIARHKQKTLGLCLETDLAQAIARHKQKTLGLCLETDLAQPVTVDTGGLVATVNQVIETDTAQLVSWSPKRRLVNQTVETDLAQSLAHTKVNTLAQASETDQAQPLTHRKMKTLGIPLETDLAQAIARHKQKTLGLCLETDLVQAILWAPKRRIIGDVVEVDLAFPITVSVGEKLVNIVRVVLELRSAVPRVVSVTSETGVVVEVSHAVSRTVRV